MALFAVAFVALAAAPCLGRPRTICGCSSEIFAYVALASLWNLLAGYAGLVSVGQQAYVGLGGYVLFALDHRSAASTRSSPIPIAGVIAARGRAAGRGV